MAFRRDRVKPTHYPRIPFHIIRSAQLLSSAVVSSIMFYFLSELARDHFKLPWTFMLLMAVALLTLISLTTTIVLHCFYGLNPALNTILNSILAVLWAVGFGLLSWWSAGTLTHVCDKENWEDDRGISVCKMYKALFSFNLMGLLATLLALILDVHVQRQAGARGRFQQIAMVAGDAKRGQASVQEDGDLHESNPNRNAVNRHRGAGAGYSVPEEQFAYGDNMGYQGAAGQMGRRSLDERM